MSEIPNVDIVADGLRMPECPRWHDGHLWFSDIRGHLVCRVDDDHTTVVHSFPDEEEPAGLGWLPEGDLLVAGMTGRVLYRVSSGSPVVQADMKSLAPHQINDMIVTSAGTEFVTQLGFDLDALQPDPKPTVLIRVGPDGTASVAAYDLMVPNGIAVDGAESTLVVAESGAGRLTRFTLQGGVLADRVEESLPGTREFPFCAPDGLCLDERGGRWVADSINKRLIRVRGGVITDEHPPGPVRIGLHVRRSRPTQPLCLCHGQGRGLHPFSSGFVVCMAHPTEPVRSWSAVDRIASSNRSARPSKSSSNRSA